MFSCEQYQVLSGAGTDGLRGSARLTPLQCRTVGELSFFLVRRLPYEEARLPHGRTQRQVFSFVPKLSPQLPFPLRADWRCGLRSPRRLTTTETGGGCSTAHDPSSFSYGDLKHDCVRLPP